MLREVFRNDSVSRGGSQLDRVREVEASQRWRQGVPDRRAVYSQGAGCQGHTQAVAGLRAGGTPQGRGRFYKEEEEREEVSKQV